MLIPNFLLNGFKNYYDNSIETVFVWVFFVPLINFTLIRRCSHYRGRAANLSYALQSWLLNSEGSLACHIYCDTGHAFTMVIPEDPWRWQFLPSDWQKSCYYCICFYDLLGLRCWDSNKQISKCETNAQTDSTIAAAEENTGKSYQDNVHKG